jgi:hypothetical protein
MAVVSTMILRSMRLIGEKVRGGTLTSDEQAECLTEFNTFLDAMPTERLLCYSVQQDSLALTASTNTYTIGTNGAFAVTRPVKIIDPCFVRDVSGYDTPLKIIGSDAYGKIVAKSAGYTVPTYLYYDAGFSATSTGTISLYPSPSGSLTLYINSWKQLGSVSTVSQNLGLPPGYQLFLESNFAIHLAAGLTPISPELAKMARESKAAIKTVNLPDSTMRQDSGSVQTRGRGVSILTGP